MGNQGGHCGAGLSLSIQTRGGHKGAEEELGEARRAEGRRPSLPWGPGMGRDSSASGFRRGRPFPSSHTRHCQGALLLPQRLLQGFTASLHGPWRSSQVHLFTGSGITQRSARQHGGSRLQNPGPWADLALPPLAEWPREKNCSFASFLLCQMWAIIRSTCLRWSSLQNKGVGGT